MKFRELVSVFLVMVLIISNVNLVFSAESTETDEITEYQSKTECDDKAVSDSAVETELLEEADLLSLYDDVTIPTSGSFGDNLTWSVSIIIGITVESSGTLTISGTGDIPDYDSYTDVPWNYYRSQITAIKIEDGVTGIGNNAFSNCTSLKSISIPDTLTSIGDYAFYSCSKLTSIEMPDSVASVNSYAFGYCSSLETLTFTNSDMTINADAFSNCTALETVFCYEGSTADNSNLYNNDTSIDYIAEIGFEFDSSTGTITGRYGTAGGHLIIPSYIDGIEVTSIKSLERMTKTVKTDSAITSISIPSTVTSITAGAFKDYSVLKYIYVSDFNSNYCSVDGVLFDTNVTDLIVCPRKIACETYEIPETVTDIEEYAFYGSTTLTNITVPSGVTSINKNTFSNSASLESLNIQGSIESIGASAFYECTSLKTFEFSDEITEISASTFYNCTNLESITIPENVTSIGNSAFYNCNSLTEIIIPDSVTSIGREAFIACSGIKTLVLSNNLTYVGSSAFAGLSSLTSVTIPESLVEPSGYMFDGCTSLTDVTLPNSITSISDLMFSSCKSLPSINIPDSVTEIGVGAFMGCTSLTDITIPNSVISLGRLSLSDCTNLESVTIPSSVTTIGSALFDGCDTDQITLYVEADSYALSYAEENGYNYVIYSPDTKKFEMPEDGYSFTNSGDSFGYEDGYKISDDIYKMFMSELDFLVFSIPEWSGSCFGIAATCLGFFEYDDSRTLYSDVFGLGTDTPFYDFDSLYDIPAPNGISELDVLTKWIEIFYASQYNDSSQSIIFSDNYSYSKNNWANMDSLVAAIENFAETGSDPIVLCLVSDRNTGHAVVPYDIEDNTETEGCYTVYIYDNNYPGIANELYIYKDESGFSGYAYDQYDYKISYIYEQDIYDIVYSAYASSVSLAEADSSESAKIYVNSDNVSIVDSSGTSVENIDGAYEIFYMDSESNTRVFSVPYGDYTVKNSDSSLSELNVSVITSVDGKSISVGDNTATITLGIYDNGYTYIGANSSSKCSMEITTVNSSGQKKVIEADCTYLFVETTEPDAVYVKSSESTVYVNGVSTKVSSLTGTALSTQDVSSGIIDIGTIILGDYDYYFEESGNTDLSCSDGKIMGNICLNLYNKSGSSFSAVVVAAVYDSEGKLVYSENKSVTVGNNSNYISLKNLDVDVSENDSYSCRVFLWKDMLSMRPITTPVDIEIS